MSQTFWRSTIFFQKPERKSTNPVRLQFSPILFTPDYFVMVVSFTKESTSQSFQRNFLIQKVSLPKDWAVELNRLALQDHKNSAPSLTACVKEKKKKISSL